MATIGLKDLYISKITSEPNAANLVYETPEKLADVIKVDLSVETAEAVLHADDKLSEAVKEFTGGTIKLNVADLDQSKLAKLLGWQADSDGVLYGSSDAVAPYVAIGFKAKKPGGKYKHVWIYKAIFGVPSENYETKGNSINFITPEIEGKFMARPDGLWKAEHTALESDAHAKAWFNKVREKKA